MNSFIRFIAVCAMCFSLQACLRGETRTLQEVLDTAKSRYTSVNKGVANNEISGVLNETTALLGTLEQPSGNPQVIANSAKLADLVGRLTEHAGYTSRPGLTELVAQLRNIGSKTEQDRVTHAQVKLLVSRLYNALASELEGQRFSL